MLSQEQIEKNKIYAEKNVPKAARILFKRAHGGKSKAAAIKSKCQECFGFDDYREAVKDCRGYTCPLWPYRPYKEK